jgi:hypothetical protein
MPIMIAPAAAAIRRVIEGRKIRQADISEQIAFFESYGMLGDAEGVRLLDGYLNGRGLLGRKESGEIRACAALGLEPPILLDRHGKPVEFEEASRRTA